MPVINANTLPAGNPQGAEHGATISVILDHSEPGHGPRLHQHPYDETWVVIDGTLTFQAGRSGVDADEVRASWPWARIREEVEEAHRRQIAAAKNGLDS